MISNLCLVASHAVANVSLECESAEVRESDGQVELCAVLTGGDLAIDITVLASTTCGEACCKFTNCL